MVFKPSNVLKSRINGRAQRPRTAELKARGRGDAIQTAWTRAPKLSAPSAKSPKTWTCRSMCCGSGKRDFRRSSRSSAAAAGATIGPTTSNSCARSRSLLYGEGYTIKGVQKLLREQGAAGLVRSAARGAAATGGRPPGGRAGRARRAESAPRRLTTPAAPSAAAPAAARGAARDPGRLARGGEHSRPGARALGSLRVAPPHCQRGARCL